jgi:hypothetical protein
MQTVAITSFPQKSPRRKIRCSSVIFLASRGRGAVSVDMHLHDQKVEERHDWKAFDEPGVLQEDPRVLGVHMRVGAGDITGLRAVRTSVTM